MGGYRRVTTMTPPPWCFVLLFLAVLVKVKPCENDHCLNSHLSDLSSYLIESLHVHHRRRLFVHWHWKPSSLIISWVRTSVIWSRMMGQTSRAGSQEKGPSFWIWRYIHVTGHLNQLYKLKEKGITKIEATGFYWAGNVVVELTKDASYYTPTPIHPLWKSKMMQINTLSFATCKALIRLLHLAVRG